MRARWCIASRTRGIFEWRAEENFCRWELQRWRCRWRGTLLFLPQSQRWPGRRRGRRFIESSSTRDIRPRGRLRARRNCWAFRSAESRATSPTCGSTISICDGKKGRRPSRGLLRGSLCSVSICSRAIAECAWYSAPIIGSCRAAASSIRFPGPGKCCATQSHSATMARIGEAAPPTL